MYELRWILLAAGAVLVAVLWLYEWRRTRNAGQDAQNPGRVEPRVEPQFEPRAGRDAVPPRPAAEVPTIRATAADRVAPPLKPPVVEIPAGVEPELDRTPHIRPDDTFAGTLPDVDPALVQAEQRQPWVRTQPLDITSPEVRSAESAGADKPARSATRAEPPREDEAKAARQRIVAIRLVSFGERWGGRAVVDALEAEGLRFGRYSIYHFQRDDGKTIFFAASMVEPGSIDPEKADEISMPGLSLFAVLPGPLEAPVAFDHMLATARRLADRLQGHLQDEQGSSLTAQRVLNMREELVHFEVMSARRKSR